MLWRNETNDMHVAIPSKGRSHAVKSRKLIPSATLYVPRPEAEEYRAACGGDVVAVPASVKGITRTRNWILDHADDRWVVFVDDDVVIERTGWRLFEEVHTRRQTLTEDEWLAEWARLFALTEDLKLRIWGVATMSAPRAIYPYRPFLFHTYITAS